RAIACESKESCKMAVSISGFSASSLSKNFRDISVFPISITLSFVSLNIEHLPAGNADKRLAAVFSLDRSGNMLPRYKTCDSPEKGIDFPFSDDRQDDGFHFRTPQRLFKLPPV